MNTFVFYLLTLQLMNNLDKCYEVWNYDDLEKKIESSGKTLNEFSYQLNSGAMVYEINDTIILLPGTLTSNYKGLIYFDRGCFLEMKNKDVFPDEVNQNYSHWEIFKNEITSLPNSNFFDTVLCSGNLPVTAFDSRDKYLEFYYNLCQKGKIKDQNKKIALAILLGDNFIKNSIGNTWQFVKQYGLFNYYYEPRIINNSSGKFYSIDLILSKISSKTPYNSCVKLLEAYFK